MNIRNLKNFKQARGGTLVPELESKEFKFVFKKH